MDRLGAASAVRGETVITVKQKGAADSSADFSAALSAAVSRQAAALTARVTAPEAGLQSAGLRSDGEEILELVRSAGESGDLGQAQLALLMLCTMMQGLGGESSEMGMMLMSAMAGLFGNLDGTAVRETVMLSDYSPSVLDAVDRHVFGNDYAEYYSNPNRAENGTTVIPAEAWRPTSPAITSGAEDRSAEKLNAVIDQFAVETSERYRPYRRGNDTYCNIFVWDVTSALGAEIPHFVDLETGEPRRWPDVAGAYELDANGIQTWLDRYGGSYGWREATAEEAQAWANEGRPAITSWNNASGIGHVQAVRPSRDGGYNAEQGVTVAQAGASRYNYGYASQSFGPSRMPQVRYYIHN